MFYEDNLNNLPYITSKIDVKIRLLDISDIDRITEVKKMSIKILEERLRNGDKCFVTENGARLLSYHRLQSKGSHFIQQTGKFEKLTKKEAVIYHVRVHKDFRGNKMNVFVYLEILRYGKNSKMNRLWIYTNKENIANRKGLEKLGFEEYKNTLSLKFYNRHYLLSSKGI